MKKSKAPLTQPLSERELNWLQDYLDTLSQTFDDCMSMEAVDGLFCALIINPLMAKPAEWMKIVFGQKHEFKSEAELEKVLGLLVRYWNHNSVLIENYSETKKDSNYLPRVIESDENKLAEQWAMGFHIGMDYCSDEWREFAHDEDNSSVLALFFLLEFGSNSDKENEAITHEKRTELLAKIPAITHKLFHYWVEKTTTASKEAKTKVGRNDPCPCGSGKKYKKCCEGQVSPTAH